MVSILEGVSQTQSENYWQGSLTCIICKGLERRAREHEVNYLIKGLLLSKARHGFMKGRPCLWNPLGFLA